MMNRLRQWAFGAGKQDSREKAAAGPASSGLRVTVDELIGLRFKAKGLNLPGHRPVTGVISGSHGSRFRGRGMDYQESRGYQPGDDIRNMDWRVTARTGSPHTKLYQEERERPVLVLLDLSPSMFFGTRGSFKSVQAVRVAALIAWAAMANGDRIGGLLFNGGHRELQPRGGHRGVLRLIRHLAEESEPVKGMAAKPHPDGLSGALSRLRRVARPGSLIFILSDFYTLDEESGKHLLQLRRHNDVIAVQVIDPLEMEPPPPGRYRVTDGERSAELDTRAAGRKEAYREQFARHHQLVRDMMRKRAVPLVRILTSDDAGDVLRIFPANSVRTGRSDRRKAI